MRGLDGPAIGAETRVLWTLALEVEIVNRRVVWRLRLGNKILRFRRGNYSRRRLVPFVERGSFGCWLASWKWGQIGWELARWT